MADVLRDIRIEIMARQAVVAQAFGGIEIRTARSSLFFWLPLPEQWRASEFAAAAEARGIRVTPGPAFAVGRNQAADQAVRVCIGAAPSRKMLRQGLARIRTLLDESPEDSLRAMA